MSSDEITKLFTYVENFRQEVGSQLEKASQERADIKGAIAELAGQIRDYHQEFLMLSRKLDRLEQAILHIAQETGVKLKFDL